MYDLVGDRVQRVFDAQVVDIGIFDREDGLVHSRYSIERGVRLPDEPHGRSSGFQQARAGDARAVSSTRGLAERPSEIGGPRDRTARRRSRRSTCRWSSAGEATGVISLQNLDRELRSGRRTSACSRRSRPASAWRSRTRGCSRRPRAAQRRARADQRASSGGLAENLDMHAMYDLVGDRLREIFDAQVVDIAMLDRGAGLDRVSRTRSSGANASPTSRSIGDAGRMHVARRASRRRSTGRGTAGRGRRSRTSSRARRPSRPCRPARRRRPRDGLISCRTSTASTRSARPTSACW